MHSEKQMWPDRTELSLLQREASEHKRAWGLVSGLTHALQRERTVKAPPSTDEQNTRIAGLEEKIVKQRRQLAQLEECRAFERETEEYLTEALRLICVPSNKNTASWLIAKNALGILKKRKGPRPQEADAS